MVKAKSKPILLLNIIADSVPNVDVFTRDELKAFVKKFKDDVHSGGLNDVSF